MGNLDYLMRGIGKNILYLAGAAVFLTGCGTPTPPITDNVSATLYVRSCENDQGMRRCDFSVTFRNNTKRQVAIRHIGKFFYGGGMVYTGQFSHSGWYDMDPGYVIRPGGKYVDTDDWVRGQNLSSMEFCYQGADAMEGIDSPPNKFSGCLRTELKPGSSLTSEAEPGWQYFRISKPTEAPMPTKTPTATKN